MRKNEVMRYLKALFKFVDVVGWQKWFGAAVLGLAFILLTNNSLSAYQFQGLLIGVVLVLCYNQAVNDCFDIQIDQLKERETGKESVVGNIISQKAALVITFTILAIGLASAILGSTELFFVVLFMALLGTLYSAPPFRLKMVYPFSTGLQLIGCFLPFVAGVACIGHVTLQVVTISTIFGFLAMVHRFEHEIENYNVDLMTNKRTVAVVNGLRTAKLLRNTMIILGVVEFGLFSVFSWFSPVFLIFFFLYLFLCIDYHFWFRRLPGFLRSMFMPIVMISGYVLLLIVLLVFGKPIII